MNVTRTQKINLVLFFLFFGLTGTFFSLECGLPSGLFLTALTWSFFILCMPTPKNAIITSFFVKLFTNKEFFYIKLIPLAAAILLNIFTYFTIPYVYLTSVTTFLLYRIISNPWPYWIIIMASSLIGIYNALTIHINTNTATNMVIKFMLAAIAITVFFYFSYIELVLFLYTKTC